MLERERLALVEVPDEELRAGPHIHEASAAVVDLVDQEEATVRPIEHPGERPSRFTHMIGSEGREALRRQRVVPEGTSSGLEPGILGPERSSSTLEIPSHPRGVLAEISRVSQADDGLVRCSHLRWRGIVKRLQEAPPSDAALSSASFPLIHRRMRNRVFFPQACLDQWGVEGKIELTEAVLVIVAEGRRFEIAEVVRVIVEVTGALDPHGIVGKVKARTELERMGAEIFESSMIIGDNAYDVVPGWAGTPVTPFEDHLLSPERMTARSGRTDIGAGPKSDEDMLARFAGGTL